MRPILILLCIVALFAIAIPADAGGGPNGCDLSATVAHVGVAAGKSVSVVADVARLPLRATARLGKAICNRPHRLARAVVSLRR